LTYRYILHIRNSVTENKITVVKKKPLLAFTSISACTKILHFLVQAV